jgi:hypothetical protein
MQSTRTHRRRSLLAAGTLVSALVASLCLAGPTLGAPARSGGPIQIFVKPNLSGRGGGRLLITGAIGDHGRSVKTNAAGQPDRKGHYVMAELHYGTLLIDTRPLNNALNRGFERARVDKASCSLHGSASATIRIVSGTGAYSGITGNLRVRFTFAELAGRYTSGAKRGSCDLHAGPVAQWAALAGTGSVSFS